jgi:hypothetical protein
MGSGYEKSDDYAGPKPRLWPYLAVAFGCLLLIAVVYFRRLL